MNDLYTVYPSAIYSVAKCSIIGLRYRMNKYMYNGQPIFWWAWRRERWVFCPHSLCSKCFALRAHKRHTVWLNILQLGVTDWRYRILLFPLEATVLFYSTITIVCGGSGNYKNDAISSISCTRQQRMLYCYPIVKWLGPSLEESSPSIEFLWRRNYS